MTDGIGGGCMTAKEMLQFKHWAVVGASRNEDSYGYKIYMKLKSKGYRVYPVSPKGGEIDGDTVYPSLSQVPQKVEVVDFVVNPTVGMDVLDLVIELGIDKIWLQPGTRGQELINKAKDNHIHVVESCVLAEFAREDM